MNPVRVSLAMALLVVMMLATVGNAGSQPDVLFAWHAVLFAAVLFAWWFATPGGTGRRPAAGVALALTGLALVVVVGLVRSPYFYAAWLAVVEVAAFFAVVVLAVRNGEWLVSWMAPVLVLGGWVQTGLLAFQRFVEHDPRPAGTFLNPNYLAGWLAATMLFCVGRSLASPGCRIARWSALAAAPLLAGFVLTGSRGALIAICAGGLLLAAIAWPKLKPSRRVGLVAALVIVGLAGGTAVVLRMRQPDPFRYQRLKIWQASITPLMSDPWTGTGPGQFSRESHNLQFPDGRGALRYDRGFRTTHSDWIRVGAELGWPGIIALAWIVVSVGAHVARRRRGSDPVDAGAVAALAGLFVQAAVDNLSRAPALYLLGATFLGIVIAVDAPARRAVRPLWRLVTAFVVLHLFVIGEVAPWRAWRAPAVGPFDPESLVSGWNPADAEALLRGVERASNWNQLEGAGYFTLHLRPLAERAVRLSPRDGELLRRFARLEVVALGVDPLHRAARDRIASLFRRSAALQRTNPFVPMELAAFLLDTGAPGAARRAAEKALEIEPEAASPRLLLARALLETGDPDRAENLLDEAAELERRYADEAKTADYASNLLTLDPALVAQVRAGIAGARQAEPGDARFDPEDQEDEAGSSRSMD